MIIWSPTKPEEGPEIDVSITGTPPWDRLSPDYQHGQIPVPGLHRMESESVTGIMEGLKLIGWTGKRGKINPAYFTGPGRPRPLKKDETREEWLLGWGYDGRCVNLPEARRLILVPAYVWMIQNKCHGLISKIGSMALKAEEDGADLHLYDGSPSDQPHEFDDRFSLASILVAYLHGDLEGFMQGPMLQ